MNESIESQVISIIANELEIDANRIRIEHSLELLGADEFGIVEICMDLEERFGLKSIPSNVYETFATVSDIVQCVEGMVEKEIQKSHLTTQPLSVLIHPMKFTDSQVIQRTFHVTTKEMLATYLDYIKDAVWDEDDVTGKIEFTEDVMTSILSEKEEYITKLFRDGATVFLIPDFNDEGLDYITIEVTRVDGTTFKIKNEDINW